MYSLLGFIQVLLMLTQSKLMLDLGFVRETKKPASGSVTIFTTGKKTWELPTTALYKSQHVEATRSNDEDDWTPAKFNTAAYFLFISQRILKPNRAPGGSKLYLVFCQLKTEG